MTMDPNTVRGLIDELLYSILFARDLNDPAKVDFVAESIRTQRLFRHSPAEYAEAIATVLNEGHLPPHALPNRNSEGEVLEWLGRLAQRLSPGSENAPTTRGR